MVGFNTQPTERPLGPSQREVADRSYAVPKAVDASEPARETSNVPADVFNEADYSTANPDGNLDTDKDTCGVRDTESNHDTPQSLPSRPSTSESFKWPIIFGVDTDESGFDVVTEETQAIALDEMMLIAQYVHRSRSGRWDEETKRLLQTKMDLLLDHEVENYLGDSLSALWSSWQRQLPIYRARGHKPAALDSLWSNYCWSRANRVRAELVWRYLRTIWHYTGIWVECELQVGGTELLKVARPRRGNASTLSVFDCEVGETAHLRPARGDGVTWNRQLGANAVQWGSKVDRMDLDRQQGLTATAARWKADGGLAFDESVPGVRTWVPEDCGVNVPGICITEH